ncbi:MAG: gliding motility lipoprotein GldD [Bacteroidia bacterium]
MRNSIFFLILILSLGFIASCDESPTPRRYTYFRIPFPEKQYQKFDSTCPFTFRHPVYTSIQADQDRDAQPCYMNLVFPDFNAKIHISYKKITDNESLYELTEDAFRFVVKHNVIAEGYEPELITLTDHDVYGLLYKIQGDVASSIQFFVTDSTDHYLRGALYFNAAPNRDSLQPVIDFIRADIDTMLQSLKWKQAELPGESGMGLGTTQAQE